MGPNYEREEGDATESSYTPTRLNSIPSADFRLIAPSLRRRYYVRRFWTME